MRRYLIEIILSIVLVASTAWAQTSITVCSYGGTYQKGLEETIGKPFTAATGIKVMFTAFPTYAQMEAQVKSGNIEWDVVDSAGRMYARGVKGKIFEPLDLSMINTKDFMEGSVSKEGIGSVCFSYNICYNTNRWPAGKGPKSIKDFWDVKKFPGPRTVKFTPDSNLEAALVADEVPKDKIYPIDVDRAFKKLTELKPDIRVFWKTGGQAQQIMREREADIGFVPGGRIIQLAEQGVPVTWEWNDQFILLDYWTILKGSKNKEAAMKFIAFASDAKRLAAFAEWTNYGSSNLRAYNYIRKEKAVLMPTHRENFAKALAVEDIWWYGEHEEEVERKWEAWKMK